MTDTAPHPSRLSALKTTPLAPGLLLALFSLGTALVLALSDDLTRDAIAARGAEDLYASLAQVLPPGSYDNDPTASLRQMLDGEQPIPVYVGAEGPNVTALAFALTGYGYGGAIRVLIGVDAGGTVLGVRVLAHAETPGLGDKIETAKSDWIEGFAGTSMTSPTPAGWKVRKDGGQFDQFSGATITPRAVVATVHRGLELFEANQAALLAPLRAEETG
ncbi:electron transport complex subunit RsxG [Alloyangia pacifica]|uniref:Ion-translocating oxidoreductase complex subunit G n=1 Tax=Alloyangia pacifica TaxID=311180 RepID=A0A1I6QT21_9RHOB|nr:electron transport complex subunit RsxG [Alloyangia pacifica]SDF98172.1 electron transport complex protein RnfG [Alloyangia pacifica]SFS55615.1 electron transport complex protein RnfG [Alloyangia pacifica]